MGPKGKKGTRTIGEKLQNKDFIVPLYYVRVKKKGRKFERCCVCQQADPSNSWTKHFNTNHTGILLYIKNQTGVFTCRKCKKSFKSHWTLSRHIKDQHLKLDTSIPILRTRFKNFLRLNKFPVVNVVRITDDDKNEIDDDQLDLNTNDDNSSPSKSSSTHHIKCIQVRDNENWSGTKTKRSMVHGTGLVTTKTFKKNEYVIEYTGEKVDRKIIFAENEDNTYRKESSIYDLQVSSSNYPQKTYFINARRSNTGIIDKAGYANHSCNPNCDIVVELVDDVLRPYLVANQNITKGTELTWDYGIQPRILPLQPCQCGDENCRLFLDSPYDYNEDDYNENKYDDVVKKALVPSPRQLLKTVEAYINAEKQQQVPEKLKYENELEKYLDPNTVFNRYLCIIIAVFRHPSIELQVKEKLETLFRKLIRQNYQKLQYNYIKIIYDVLCKSKNNVGKPLQAFFKLFLVYCQYKEEEEEN